MQCKTEDSSRELTVVMKKTRCKTIFLPALSALLRLWESEEGNADTVYGLLPLMQLMVLQVQILWEIKHCY